MYYIDLTISGQTLTAPEEILVVNGTKGLITCRFTFTSWDEFTTKTAIFKNSSTTKEVEIPIKSNNTCVVPTQALLFKGTIQIAIRGENSTQVQRTNTSAIIKQIYTLQGGLVAEEIPQSQYSKYVDTLKEEVEKVTGMIVSSHTLTPGSAPTVTKTIGEDEKVNLDFGLSSGEKGEKGDTGPAGGTFPDASSDTKTYARKDASWVEVYNKTEADTLLLSKADIDDVPTSLAELAEDSTHRVVTDAEKASWNAKQETLISGTNIKTIKSNSILGSGDIDTDPEVYIKDVSINNNTITFTDQDNVTQSYIPALALMLSNLAIMPVTITTASVAKNEIYSTTISYTGSGTYIIPNGYYIDAQDSIQIYGVQPISNNQMKITFKNLGEASTFAVTAYFIILSDQS